MPYSFDYYNENVKNIVRKYGIKKVFDVGVGAGKYGKILNGIVNILDGCEPEVAYIDKLKPSGYRDIYNEYFDVKLRGMIENMDLTPYERKTTVNQEIILVLTEDYVKELGKKW